MNRLKLWVFVLLAVGAGVAGLYAASGSLAASAIEAGDARLSAGKALLEARTRLLSREGASVAGAAARAPALAAALAPKPPLEPPKTKGRRPAKPPPPPPPPVDPVPLAESAARSAAQAAGTDAARGLLAGLVRESGLSLRSGGREAKVENDASAASLRQTAQDGRSREALLRVDQVLFYTVAVSLVPGTALAVGLPLDAAWAQPIRAATGADVTIVVDAKRTVSTLAPSEAKALIAAASKLPPSPVDVGTLGRVKLHGGLPIPAMPLLFARAPNWRAQGMTLPGISEAVVLSRPMRPQLAALAVGQQVALLVLAGLFLVGLVLGFLVRGEPPPAIPKDLFTAADRIAHGEFEARAPVLAGQLGTVADALNRAAEAAAAASGPEPTPAPSLELPPQAPAPADLLSFEPIQRGEAASAGGPLGGEQPPRPAAAWGETTARDFFAEPLRPSEAAMPPAGPALAELESGEPLAAPSEPPPVHVPASRVEPFPVPGESLPPPPPAPMAAQAPAAGGEEELWRQVFEEFLRVRQQCGESFEGLTYEKFRQKLQKNKDSLVEKYACKEVRFQVYVKEGKAALKATPVR